jgi:hypothetical protein
LRRVVPTAVRGVASISRLLVGFCEACVTLLHVCSIVIEGLLVDGMTQPGRRANLEGKRT